MALTEKRLEWVEYFTKGGAKQVNAMVDELNSNAYNESWIRPGAILSITCLCVMFVCFILTIVKIL